MESAAVCWCAGGDIGKCPHNVSTKIQSNWEELEQTIDTTLRQFDRKTIRKFLKRDVDGNSKTTNFVNDGKKAYNQDLQKLVTSAANSKGKEGPPSSHFLSAAPPIISSASSSFRPTTAPENGNGKQSKSLLKRPYSPETKRPYSPGVRKPGSSSNTNTNTSTSSNNNNNNNNIVHKRPGPPGHFHNTVSVDQEGFAKTMPIPGSKNSLSLPLLSTPAESASTHQPSSPLPLFVLKGPQFNAWGDNANDEDLPHVITSPTPILPISVEPGPYSGIPGDTAVAAGLMRIADVLARKLLPWQAVQCPRSIEALRDVRANWIQGKHIEFVAQMTRQLEDKVYTFFEKKEQEVDMWMEREVTAWQQAMTSEETTQAAFFREDQVRINNRLLMQEKAGQTREITMASALDEKERDATREQLVNFRRLCRSDTTKIDVRVLHASIDSAQSKALAQTTVTNRDIFRRTEEVHSSCFLFSIIISIYLIIFISLIIQ